MNKTGRTGLSGWLTPTTFVGLLLLATLALVFGALLLIEPDDGPTEEPPSMSFVMNETRDTLRVNATDDGLDWMHLQVAMDRPGMFMVQGDENRSTAEPMVFQRVSNESTIEEGDRLWFCLTNGDVQLEVTLRHAGTGRVIDTFLFPEVASCEPEESEEPDENETDENETDDNVTDDLPTGPDDVTSRSVPKQEG